MKPALLAACAASAAAIVLTGCGTHARTITGRVATGPVSSAMTVAETDSRFDGVLDGVSGVNLRIETEQATGAPAVISETESGEGGEFTLKLPGNNMPTRATVVAEREGYVTARRAVFLPTSGQQLLVLLQELAGRR